MVQFYFILTNIIIVSFYFSDICMLVVRGRCFLHIFLEFYRRMFTDVYYRHSTPLECENVSMMFSIDIALRWSAVCFLSWIGSNHSVKGSFLLEVR